MSEIRLLLLGAGYTAGYVADALRSEAISIQGTTRSEQRFAGLRAQGIEPLLFDASGDKVIGNATLLHEALANASHIVISVAPNATGPVADPLFECVSPVLRDLAATSARPRWLGYLSTVGVYGDAKGQWVDEQSPCEPSSNRSCKRLEAEQQWQALAQASGGIISVFRLPGIYGPRRNALVNLHAGKARRLIKSGQVFNRAHVEDIARAVKCAALANIGGIFNICDDYPSPPQDVVSYAAELMGIEPPPEIDFEQANLSAMARSFYADNKRVSNEQSKKLPQMQYRYPDYKTGLSALWDSGLWRQA